MSNYLVHKNLTIKKLFMYERDYGLPFFIKAYFIIISNMRQPWLCKPQFYGTLNCYVSNKQTKNSSWQSSGTAAVSDLQPKRRIGTDMAWNDLCFRRPLLLTYVFKSLKRKQGCKQAQLCGEYWVFQMINSVFHCRNKNEVQWCDRCKHVQDVVWG